MYPDAHTKSSCVEGFERLRDDTDELRSYIHGRLIGPRRLIENREFIAAKSSDDTVLMKRILKTPGYLNQDAITGLMAVYVVDGFKPIEIEQHQTMIAAPVLKPFFRIL